MANNNGNSLGSDTSFPYTEVADKEGGKLRSPDTLKQHEASSDGSFSNEISRRINEGLAEKERTGSLQPKDWQAPPPQSTAQQSQQQSVQASNTREYASEQEKGSLTAIQNDQSRMAHSRGEHKSLNALQQDAQSKNDQRLGQGHTQEQAKEQNQQQQKGQEKGNEQQKQQGR